MAKIKGLLFWGYLDSDGQIVVKYYTNDNVIANYERLPFIKGIFDVFEAYSIEEARQMVKIKYEEEVMNERFKAH